MRGTVDADAALHLASGALGAGDGERDDGAEHAELVRLPERVSSTLRPRVLVSTEAAPAPAATIVRARAPSPSRAYWKKRCRRRLREAICAGPATCLAICDRLTVQLAIQPEINEPSVSRRRLLNCSDSLPARTIANVLTSIIPQR